jgi:hypothetical protein
MNIIYTFTNKDVGIGDNLRGLISLLQIEKIIKTQKNINITIYVDFSESSINKYLLHKLPDELLKLKETIELKTLYYHSESIHNEEIIDYILNSQTNTVRINTNNYPDINNITEDIKLFIKQIFKWKPYFEGIINDYLDKIPENYDFYHYRFGDHKFNDDGDDLSISEMIEKFQKLEKSSENCVIISDSLNFKKKIHEIYNNNKVIVFLNKPTHTNNTTNEEDIFIFIDFFLAIKAKKIYCYSFYNWISNFVLWNSYIYNIPLINMKS